MYARQLDGSGNPCSEEYSGPQASSEPETKAISSYLLSHAPVSGAIDFHSYYQEVLYPYGGCGLPLWWVWSVYPVVGVACVPI